MFSYMLSWNNKRFKLITHFSSQVFGCSLSIAISICISFTLFWAGSAWLIQLVIPLSEGENKEHKIGNYNDIIYFLNFLKFKIFVHVWNACFIFSPYLSSRATVVLSSISCFIAAPNLLLNWTMTSENGANITITLAVLFFKHWSEPMNWFKVLLRINTDIIKK